MIHEAKDLSSDQKTTLEGILGSSIADDEAIAVRKVGSETSAQTARDEQEHATSLVEVARAYVMPPDRSVQAFLNFHRELPHLLIQAIPHLREKFGDVAFALRVTSDEHGWQNLYVDALWPRDAAEAYEKLNRFEDDWWIANSQLGSGHLTFTYRLV